MLYFVPVLDWVLSHWCSDSSDVVTDLGLQAAHAAALLREAGSPTRIAAAKPAAVCELVRQMMQVLQVQRDREWVAGVATKLLARLAVRRP